MIQTPEQALLANALADKAIAMCEHRGEDAFEICYHENYACRQCVEEILLEAMGDPDCHRHCK